DEGKSSQLTKDLNTELFRYLPEGSDYSSPHPDQTKQTKKAEGKVKNHPSATTKQCMDSF
ncbi:MAG: hypothetical protein ACRCYC_06630, partial [Paraclostridium sp.]|uniref:hypothetical protein n=1 Tax=Paraclostridium sp. TaxID=2023273 RepID=UPI003F36352E